MVGQVGRGIGVEEIRTARGQGVRYLATSWSSYARGLESLEEVLPLEIPAEMRQRRWQWLWRHEVEAKGSGLPNEMRGGCWHTFRR